MAVVDKDWRKAWQCPTFDEVNCACPQKLLGHCLLAKAQHVPDQSGQCRECRIEITSNSRWNGYCQGCMPESLRNIDNEARPW